MKNIFSWEVNRKYLFYLSWLIIFFILVVSYKRFPLNSDAISDETGYSAEVTYFAKYGIYNALSQGTSFVYSLMIFVFSNLFSVDYLVSARILTSISFLICCGLFLKCLDQFAAVSSAVKYFGLVYFGTICMKWLWKGLPDLMSIAFLLAGFYFILISKNYKQILLAGILLFAGFTIKPVVIFAVPGLIIFIFLKNLKTERWIGSMLKVLLFIISFGSCFIIYHIPGYNTYNRLMLEDKNHTYQGGRRVENPITWNEKNIYFEVYNVHHRVNKWAVSFEEVDRFERQHPEINLKLSYINYLKDHPGNWLKEVSRKVYLDLPYYLQIGFFFSKWTIINKLVNNYFIIMILTTIIIMTIIFLERKFIWQNRIYLLVPFFFYLLLSFYTIPQLEDNWILFCLPFLALPVIKFLTTYINGIFLLVLQFIFILLF